MKQLKKLCSLAVALAVAVSAYAVAPVRAASDNYLLGQTVTASGNSFVDPGNPDKYSHANLTDGVTTGRDLNGADVISYSEGLAYYQVSLAEETTINQVILYFNVTQPENRPLDYAVDLLLADGSWKRAAQLNNQAALTSGTDILDLNFAPTACTAIRVTASNERNSSENFALQEIEAYLNPNIGEDDYAGTAGSTDGIGDIPLQSSENYALGNDVTASSEPLKPIENPDKFELSNLTDGVTTGVDLNGASTILFTDNIAYYQIRFDETVAVNQVKLFFNDTEREKTPQDFAIELLMSNGTWRRVAQRHNYTEITGLKNRVITFNFALTDCIGVRVLASNERNKNCSNFALQEIEVYNNPNITSADYTGNSDSTDGIGNIAPSKDVVPDTGVDGTAVLLVSFVAVAAVCTLLLSASQCRRTRKVRSTK